ncbi:Quinolinate phosphoribosyl transferase [Lipomyces orientalis]|uniref:Quinolinate phosphoribosyl transferase n=1 Tax=Lipomyces orientalis TaxID=1233043 RepID=A0ACC3TNF1_9ASCO
MLQPHPERAVFSLLDTDLYKLTMQAAVLDHYPNTPVSYSFKNRTPQKKLNQAAFDWLQAQINLLGSLSFSPEEINYLRSTVKQLPERYLVFLETFKLSPKDHVQLEYDLETQDVKAKIKGLWVDTILYEIPILALVSEAYFKFVDTDWDYGGQEASAETKSLELLNFGCAFSEFGTRRRRSFKAQELVMRGLVAGDVKYQSSPAAKVGSGLRGTSNVYFAWKFGIPPIGTVAHEWMMGIAAVSQDYWNANLLAMDKWRATMGDANVGVALTDTFGTDAFLRVFTPKLANIYAGVRQDSGDPLMFLDKIAKFYDEHDIDKSKKVVVFSDSLDIEACKKYKIATEKAGMLCSFGVGTFFTNDFHSLTPPHKKSTPLNIVIKLSSANGKPAIKVSDNLGKNTGDKATVERVKHELGYIERSWAGGDEEKRWNELDETASELSS